MKEIKLKIRGKYITQYLYGLKTIEIRRKNYNLEIGDKIIFYNIDNEKELEANVIYIEKVNLNNKNFWLDTQMCYDKFIKKYIEISENIYLIYLNNIKKVN